MHHISIIEQRPDASKGQENCWWFNVQCDSALHHKNLKIQDPYLEKEENDFRWYLEKYTVQDSFEDEKAAAVAKSLQKYGESIFRQLRFAELVSSWAGKSQVRVKVEIDIVEHGESTENADAPLKTIHRLHWEVLETLELWLPILTQVSIKRRSSNMDTGIGVKHITSWPLPNSAGMEATCFNVLLVVSRRLIKDDAKHQDVDPTHALKVLLGIKEYLQASEAPFALNVEVVRPGTLAALKKHLENTNANHGPGYFKLVHFDMHGFVGKGKQDGSLSAYLKFANPKDPKEYSPVRSLVVARLLEKYKINIAVLGACETANPNKGVQANLAKTFVSEGVANVLAMSHKFVSGASVLFFGAFYRSFFLGNATFSEAVSFGRRYLKSHPLRESRFGEKVELADWLVPVTYTNGQDVKVLATLDSDKVLEVPEDLKLDSSEPEQSRWHTIGREYDKLRFEDYLLRTRIVYLHGPAGCGKTEMILDLARDWLQTEFVDHVTYLHIRNLDFKSILRSIQLDLNQFDKTEPMIPDEAISEEHILSRLHRKSSVVILDNLVQVYNKPFLAHIKTQDPKAFENFKQSLLSFLHAFMTPSTSDAVTASHVIILGRGNEEWVKDYFPALDASTFPLAGLGLADAVALSRRILQRQGVKMQAKTRDAEMLTQIVDMLQRLPRTLELVLPKISPKRSLESFVYELIDGDVTLSLDECNSAVTRYSDNFAEMLECSFQSEDGDMEAQLYFSHFWREGPGDVMEYIQNARKVSLRPPSEDVDSSIRILMLQDINGWTINGSSMDWIHPILTLYLRGKLKRYASWWAPENIHFLREQFISAVAERFNTKFITGATSGQNMPEFCEFQRPSLVNLLHLLRLCTSKVDLMPTKKWPVFMVASNGPASRLGFSVLEQSLLAAEMEKMLKLYLERKNTYAFGPGDVSGPLSLALHLAAVHFIELATKPNRGSEFVNIALQIISASEKKFGPLKKSDLPYKGVALRYKAKALLDEGRALEAVALMKESKSMDAELWVNPSASAATTTVDQNLNPIQKALDNAWERGGSFRKPREALIDEIISQVESGTALKDLSLSDSEIQKMNKGLSEVVKTHEETGQVGLDHWNRWFPHDVKSEKKDIDIAYYIRRLEDPKYRLEELAEAIDLGDWASAIKHHEALIVDAAKNQKAHHVLRHADEISKLYQLTNNPDPATLEKLQATRFLAKELTKIFDGVKFGESSIIPMDYVQETLMPCLRTIRGEAWAQQIWDIFNCFSRGLQVPESELAQKIKLSRELVGDHFTGLWERHLEELRSERALEMDFLERLRIAMEDEFGSKV